MRVLPNAEACSDNLEMVNCQLFRSVADKLISWVMPGVEKVICMVYTDVHGVLQSYVLLLYCARSADFVFLDLAFLSFHVLFFLILLPPSLQFLSKRSIFPIIEQVKQ